MILESTMPRGVYNLFVNFTPYTFAHNGRAVIPVTKISSFSKNANNDNDINNREKCQTLRHYQSSLQRFFLALQIFISIFSFPIKKIF